MTLQARFNAFYDTLDLSSLQDLGQIYDSQVTFSDPVAVHLGRPALDTYFRKLLQGCKQCSFVIRNQWFDDSQAFVHWTMTFANPRLNKGEPIDVDGSSVIEIRDDRIVSQRDHYDMGAMVYEQLPILGTVIRYIRGRMAA